MHESSPTQTFSGNQWLQYPFLLQDDKERLESGKWLNTRLIEAAQLILSKQFPDVKGFQSPLFGQNLSFRKVEGSFIQILHTRQSHWIAVSDVCCSRGEVVVYDSAYNSLDLNCKKQLFSLMQPTSNSVRIHLANIQRQPNASDCGLFAIACATELANKKDPTHCWWNVHQMRQHLKNCLEEGTIEPFPLQKPRRIPIGRVLKKSMEELVYCVCRMPNDRSIPMIACDSCKAWFHQKCVSISKDMKAKNWLCYNCR